MRTPCGLRLANCSSTVCCYTTQAHTPRALERAVKHTPALQPTAQQQLHRLPQHTNPGRCVVRT